MRGSVSNLAAAELVGRLLASTHIRGFPKIRGTFLGVPKIRTLVFWGLYWGPPMLGKLLYAEVLGSPHHAS